MLIDSVVNSISETLLAPAGFLNKKDIPFIDYAHFNGNRLLIAPKKDYLDNFYMLPYYKIN